MSDLASQLSAACVSAFEAEGLDARWGQVRPSDRPELADFQCNGCMGAAKQAKTNPRELAARIAPHVELHPLISRVDIAGPGFLNIVVKTSALSERVEGMRTDPKAGGAFERTVETVVFDYGGPNVAKPMHVGHLRSAVIGDTLCRLFRFLGDRVIGDVHLGDWGLQMGLLIVALQEEQPDLPYFDPDAAAPFPAEPPITMDDLSRLYPMASARSKKDEDYAERARLAVAEMQDNRAGYRALLKHFIDVSVAALKVDYAFLDVSFDLWKGESDVDHLLADVLTLFQDKGLAIKDDGAIIVPVATDSENIPVLDDKGAPQLDDDGRPKLKKPMPPVMLQNSRGGTGYHATDLATIFDRQKDLSPDRILYVVDQRQALHFTQVFRASDKADMFAQDKLEHLGFGTVNGDDGKPFKTREGGVLRLADLNSMALEEATAKSQAAGVAEGLSVEDQTEIHQLVARAALRFADLQNQRTTNYVFDLARFTSFEGKTGPYLLYAAVRLKALLRRAAAENVELSSVVIESDAERKLALVLDGFALALRIAQDKRMPHFVCEHVYTLAQTFSTWYASHPIFKADVDPKVRSARLALCHAVLVQLEAALGILGITAPEQM